ncbi:MAG TPA: ATP-binding protein, partial [Trinickia sp.]|uniref:ATP-binding protein n=1 Tax=Trinickia sp. TaxID=2571163 RepID=UPI002C3AF7F1
APLLRACLLDTSDASVPTMTGTYRLAQPLLAYLTGIAAPQLRIDEVPLVELEEDGALEDQLIDEETKRQLTRFIEASADSRFASQTFLLLLQGMDSALLKSLCAAIFAELGYATAELDGKRLRRAYERWGGRHSTLVNHLRVLCRDAVLCNTVIVLTDCQSLMGSIEGESTDDILDEVLHMLFDMHRYVVVLNPSLPRVLESAHRYLDHGVMPFRLRIDAPDADLRRRAWIKHAARYDLELDPEFIEQLVDGFHFTEERLPILLKEVATKTLLLDLPNVKDLVIEACRAEAQSGQIGVAKELKTSYRLRDVIAPEHTLDLLSELLTHVRYRRRVVEEWGFARHSGNRNVTAVFHGPSGTGKTMAASMIANELGLSIYRVDMASILSKYIGETERNLEQLFERAEAMNVVIFLDEAESLFGKRTENKDAHDRYANYQTAYLLQRIETYAGLVILATNLLGNIDKAFLRRFRFVINFPFPTTEQRKTLWRQAFPSATPIADDVDFDLLGEKAVLAGGSIQTAAISAAFRAAAQDVPVSMHHIVKSIEREYTKGGKVFVASDFGDAAIVYL